MLYPYHCGGCDKSTDIVKPASEATREEPCPSCGTVLTRIWTGFQIVGAKVEDREYNLGLGCVTKGKRHREEIAKQKGLIEIGSETPTTLHKESVVKRAKEREKEWDNL